MRRAMKWGCLSAAVILICAGIYVINAFYGNPISAYLAERAAREYIEAHYADLDVQIKRVRYSFKTADYVAQIASPASMDTHFEVYIRMNGEVRNDTYESVTGGWNTWQRLEENYRKKVNALLDAPDFEIRHDIAYGTIEIDEQPMFEYKPEAYGVKFDELILDGQYDMDVLGEAAGRIVFYMQDEDVSYETAARGMLRLRALLEDNGIAFHAVDFVLRLPREEGAPGTDEPSIRVENFPREEIVEDGMAERVKRAHEARAAFYAQMDAK